MGNLGTTKGAPVGKGAPARLNDKGWRRRFRRVQEKSAQLAAESGVETKDVPKVLREQRALRDDAEMGEARSMVARRLSRRRAADGIRPAQR